MSSRKDEDLKQFLVSRRKKIGPGLTNAPVWAMQKKGERIWNTRRQRNWKDTKLGAEFRKRKKKKK